MTEVAHLGDEPRSIAITHRTCVRCSHVSVQVSSSGRGEPVDRRDATRAPVYKFTQKLPGGDPSTALLTTMYVTRAEYELLRSLGGDVVSKVRYRFPSLVIDVFDAPLDGLVLAEVEMDVDHARDVVPPPGVIAEVTHDVRYTGGSLARDGMPDGRRR